MNKVRRIKKVIKVYKDFIEECDKYKFRVLDSSKEASIYLSMDKRNKDILYQAYKVEVGYLLCSKCWKKINRDIEVIVADCLDSKNKFSKIMS